MTIDAAAGGRVHGGPGPGGPHAVPRGGASVGAAAVGATGVGASNVGAAKVGAAASAAAWSAAVRVVTRALLVALLAFLPVAPALAQQPLAVPPLSARVTDLTGTLDAAARARLEGELAELERRRGAQVAILLVPTTQPETIEEYAIRVADAWKLGRGRERAQRDTGDKGAQAIDDGVLVLVAKNDRRVRIEVGYGLEGAIPDAVAKRIVAESITPRFRAGDFAGGLEAAVADLSRRIGGEDLPPPWQPAHRDGTEGLDVGGALLPALAMAFFVGLVASRVAGRFIGAAVGGGAAGTSTAALLASSGLGLAVGFGVFVLLLGLGGRGGGGPGGGLRRVGRRTIGHGPVIVPGGFGGWGGGGGGGFGGGGFSGGGGGFGGGGASGDW